MFGYKVRALRYVLPCVIALCSCGNGPQIHFFSASNYPQQLSAWGLFDADAGHITLPAANHVYDLNTSLFTDYALKLRTLYVPADKSAAYHATDTFELPVGSIISKTFFYPTDEQGAVSLEAHWDGNPEHIDLTKVRLIETRLLVRQAHGWDALPYIWRDGEAYLAITGDLFTLPVTDGSELNYLVPSRNQCAGCHAENHTSGALKPIGIKARHLNREDPIHGKNQLTAWQQRGQLAGLPGPSNTTDNTLNNTLNNIPTNARWDTPTADLNHRARSYLDINCGHCHNAKGAADTSGLLLDYQDHPSGALGVCKPPIAAGRGSGGRLYSIVPGHAEQSILSYRMSTTDPATMMPELGRSRVHREGLALVEDWIASMQGACL